MSYDYLNNPFEPPKGGHEWLEQLLGKPEPEPTPEPISSDALLEAIRNDTHQEDTE